MPNRLGDLSCLSGMITHQQTRYSTNEVILWPITENRIILTTRMKDTLTPEKPISSVRIQTSIWAVIRESMWLDKQKGWCPMLEIVLTLIIMGYFINSCTGGWPKEASCKI